MHLIFRSLTIAALLITSACSTVIEGRTQKIAVDTLPSGASCVVKDNDLVLARVQTPGIAVVEKSKNDILVECAKDGYIPNKQRNKSDMAITSLGNMAFGQWSFIGNAVDSASGASHKYDSRVFIALNPLPPVAMISDQQPQLLAQTRPISPDATLQAVPVESVSAEPLGQPAAPQNWAHMPPDQVASELARILQTQKVVVTHRPADEVIRGLMNGQPVEGLTVEGMNQAAPVQQVASLSIYHSAE